MTENEKTPLMIAVAKRVKESGRSYRDISLKSGMNERAVKDIIDGNSKNPRYETLLAIASALNVSVDDLHNTNDMTPKNLSSIFTAQKPQTMQPNLTESEIDAVIDIQIDTSLVDNETAIEAYQMVKDVWKLRRGDEPDVETAKKLTNDVLRHFMVQGRAGLTGSLVAYVLDVHGIGES